jgi:hypothetical protein
MKTQKLLFIIIGFFFLLSNAGCVDAQKKDKTNISQVAVIQSEVDEKARLERKKADVESLVFDAQSQQPEIAADVLIRIVESNKVITNKRKIELLEEAFRQALNVKHSIRLGYSGQMDTPSGMLSEALDLELDKLSLQSRIITAMLSLDKKKAREMFNDIPTKLDFASKGCKEGFIYAVADKPYETLNVILANTFTEKEKKQNAHILYALPYIENMTSPSQVVPLIKTILSLKPNQSQLSILGDSFSRALKNVSGDDYSFRNSMSGNYATLQINNFRKEFQKKQLPDQELTNSFRTYLLKQLNGNRCSDGLKLNNDVKAESKYLLPSYIEFANANLFINNPIKAEQIEPFKVENAEESVDYYPNISEESRSRKYSKLRFGDGESEISETQKDNDQWKTSFAELLNDAVAWSPNDSLSDIDYFHQKCTFFLAILEIVPKNHSDLRIQVLKDYGFFLSNSKEQRENCAEWLMQVQRLLHIIEVSNQDEKLRLAEVVKDTKNTAMILYLKLKTFEEPSTKSVK